MENIHSMSGEKLIQIFRDMNVPLDEPGFYDHPNFLFAETKNRRMLDLYAAHVTRRAYSLDYLELVRNKVTIIAEILFRELLAEGRLGACVDLSLVLSRILDAEGIWNYVVKGACSISLPSKTRVPTQYFWPLDVENRAGHVWVHAPPFKVIDLTIRQQPHPYEPIKSMLPNYALIESGGKFTPTVIDICSPEIRMAHNWNTRNNDLHFRLQPHLRDNFLTFPATEKYLNKVKLRYIPCASSASDIPLKEFTNQKWNGRFGYDLYCDLVRPALADLPQKSFA